MRAEDVMETLDFARSASGVDRVRVHGPPAVAVRTTVHPKKP